jgi:type 1 fimbriae regulatory protein FimB/type 1 fimbriae regulatory protein FimE
MTKPALRLVPPPTDFGVVTAPVPTKPKPPRRLPNKAVRSREHLTEAEVDRLLKATGKNRYSHRDYTLLLLTFRHGLRTAEVTRLKWEAVDLEHGELHVVRVKKGKPATHPLAGIELRALRRLKRAQHPPSPFVFTSERGALLAPRSFRQMIARLGKAAKFEFTIHPHMLRHACGYKLANDGHPTRHLQDYLGHKNIQHTVRYTELSPTKFRNFWRD